MPLQWVGKGSSTTSRGQDQDISAEVPPWLMISSWKLFYVENQSCCGTHSSRFGNLIFPFIPTYRQTEDLKVSTVFLTFFLVKVHCKISPEEPSLFPFVPVTVTASQRKASHVHV